MGTRVTRGTRVSITTKRATMGNTVRNIPVVSIAITVAIRRNTTTKPDTTVNTIRERRGIRERSTVRRVDIRRATRHTDTTTNSIRTNTIKSISSTMTTIREDITASTATSTLITTRRKAATRREAIISPATMMTISVRRATMTRVIMKMNIRAIRVIMVTKSTMGTTRTTERRVVTTEESIGVTAKVTDIKFSSYHVVIIAILQFFSFHANCIFWENVT
jgi:hypothetical protein